MKIGDIVNRLTLFDNLNRKERIDLLFNTALISHDFLELLRAAHNIQVRKFINDYEHVFMLTTSRLRDPLVTRLLTAIADGANLYLKSEEFFILKVLASSKYLTVIEWAKLKELLGYEEEALPVKHEVTTLGFCPICSFPTNADVCLSCKRNIKSFLKYRRESFCIPINYLNFNIRNAINSSGSFSLVHKDWTISKSAETLVVTCELGELNEGFEPYEPPLPFVDYQRSIV